jgi:PhnB protein
MASDIPPGTFQPMRSVYLSLGVDSGEEAERIFALLPDGGQVYMPMQEAFLQRDSLSSGTSSGRRG